VADKKLRIVLEVDTTQGEKLVKVNKLVEDNIEKVTKSTTALTAIERQRNEILARQGILIGEAAAKVGNINAAVASGRMNPWFADGAAAATITGVNNRLRETNEQLRNIAINSRNASTLGIAPGTGQRTAFSDPNPYVPQRQEDLIAARVARERRAADEIAAYAENAARESASRAIFHTQAETNSRRVMYARMFDEIEANERRLTTQRAINSQSFAARIGSTPIPTDMIGTLTRYQRAQAALVESTREATVAQRSNTTAIADALPPHRNLFLRIGELVGIYRLWTTAMHLAKRAFLDIPQAGIEQQSTQASVNAIFGSKEGGENLQFIRKLADEAGQSILALEQAYRTFAPSATLAGATQVQVNTIFEDFTKVGTVLHLAQDKMKSVFLALEQMFAKGVVQSEEIKKQLGNVLPGAVEVAARALGKSPAAFMEAMKKNLVIAKDAVPKIAAEYRKIFAGDDDSVFKNVADKLQANLGRIRTQYELLDREIFAVAQSTFNFFVRSAADSLKALSDNLRAVFQIASVGLAALTVKLLDLSAAFIAARIASVGFVASLTAIRNTVIGIVTFTNPFIAGLAGIAAGIAGVTTASLAASGATISYGRFVNASRQQIADLQAVYAAQGKGAQEAGEQLEKLARMQEQSSSYFIEYKGNYLEFSSVAGALWETIKDLATRAITEIKSNVENLLITPIKTWLNDFKTFAIDIFSFILNNMQDMQARIQSTSAFFASLANDAGDLNFKGSLDRAVAAQEDDAKRRKEFFEKQNQANYEFLTDIGTTLTDKAKSAGERLVDDFKLGASAAGDIIGDRAKVIQDRTNKQKLDSEPTFPGIAQTPIESDIVADAAKKAKASSKITRDLYKDIIRDSRLASEAISEDLKAMSFEYETHLVSIGTFYENKKALIEEDLTQQLEANERLKEIATRANDTAKLEEFLDREQTLLREANTKSRELSQAKYNDLKKYNELLQSTQAEYLDFLGQTGQANVIKFSLQNKERVGSLMSEYASGDQRAGEQLSNLKVLQDDASLRGEINKLEVQRTKITTDYRAELDKTNVLFNTSTLSQMDSLRRITELNNLQIEQLGRLTQQEEAQISAIQRKGGVVAESLLTSLDAHKREIESLRLTANAVAEHFRSTMGAAFDDAFAGLITGSMTAKQAFTSFATAVQQDIAKIIASEVRSKIIGAAFNAVVGAATSSLGYTGSGNFGTSGGGFGSATDAGMRGEFGTFANGGVVASPGISAYSGQVVSSPTIFPFAKGTGLMGEAGPEGILPLKRNSQGKLGVSADLGSSAGINIESLSVHVESKDGTTSQEQAEQIGKAVREQLKGLIVSQIRDSTRSGNTLNPTKMAANF
jgi:tape measure domain-containing protein